MQSQLASRSPGELGELKIIARIRSECGFRHEMTKKSRSMGSSAWLYQPGSSTRGVLCKTKNLSYSSTV
jgi:hypothetical protein